MEIKINFGVLKGMALMAVLLGILNLCGITLLGWWLIAGAIVIIILRVVAMNLSAPAKNSENVANVEKDGEKIA